VNRFVSDLACDACQLVIDTIDDPDRPRHHEIARDNAHCGICHRRIGQSLTERGFDIEAQFAGGFLRAFERHLVGDTQAVMKARIHLAERQLLFYLGARAVHQHHLDAQCMQQRKVMRQHGQRARPDQLTRESDHEGLAPERVDVGGYRAQPADELNRVFHEPHYNSPRHVRS